ncbi:MAG TPA: polysaccharide deacetylase family protein [Miltoncostaeaceae bacterium]|nr:polysaccharide deacetylase family protein [Miltoncostaeaceae bacterium]
MPLPPHASPLRTALTVAVAAVALVALPACGGGGEGEDAAEVTAAPTTATATPAPAVPVAELAARGVDEGGLVPVLMYHEVAAQVGAGDEYSTTPARLREDLERLHAGGYRPVSLSDLVDGRIDVPLGTTPVVITFDDGAPGQFRLLPGGEVDPESAVGILNAFAERNPDWGRRAVFYVNDRPFGQPGREAEKLRMLAEWGYEVGNHTLTHRDLSTLAPGQVRRELAGLTARVQEHAPDVRLRHLALPFGAMPRSAGLARSGEAGGTAYRHDSVALVGAEPAPSPFARRFDPLQLPRIRAAADDGDAAEWGDWRRRLDDEGLRFVSDGDPDVVTVSRDLVPRIRVRPGQTLRVVPPGAS